MKRPVRGFTLIELVMVIMLTGVLAAAVTVFLRPAVDAYRDTRVRGELAELADIATQRLLRDVRAAVPNSIRWPGSQCVEMVPSSAGGRYRMAPDTARDTPGCTPSATCSAPLDPTQATTTIDVLTTLQTTPAVGDYIVINNQNGNDVYSGTVDGVGYRATLTGVSTPTSTQGKHRLTVASTAFPPGYDGGRLMIVPASQQAVFYVCSGADGTVDANGDGKGTLYRLKAYGFNATAPTACPTSLASADVVATKVKSCQFVYDPNQGSTQQSGFLWLRLDLSRNNETATLAAGAHVSNVP